MKGQRIFTKCFHCKKVIGFDHAPYLNRLEVPQEDGSTIVLTIQMTVRKGDTELSGLQICCEECVEKLCIQGVSQ